MTHYSEHLLELYVLGSDEVSAKRDRIEEHLRECSSCKELVEDLAFFHSAVRGKQLLNGHHTNGLILRPEYSRVIVSSSKVGALASRVWSLVRTRPIVSSGVALAGIAVVLFFTWNRFTAPESGNPAYAMLNSATNAFEVYDNQHNKLWHFPYAHAAIESDHAATRNISFSWVGDLDGDGLNEIVTTLKLPEERLATKVRIFDAKRNVLAEREFPERSVSFRAYQYDTPWVVHALWVGTVSGRKEIFVVANNGRSPNFIARLDTQLNIIGRYWHFGQFQAIHGRDLNGDGLVELILHGSHDVSEEEKGQPPVIVVLDPTKIVGEVESSVTRGFGYEPCVGELYYVRIPLSDLHTALGTWPYVHRLQPYGDASLHFSVVSNTPTMQPTFEFIFSSDMSALEVKYGSPTAVLHRNLKQAGKISSTFGRTYLENLRKAVRYWDGSDWRAERVMVQQIPF